MKNLRQEISQLITKTDFKKISSVLCIFFAVSIVLTNGDTRTSIEYASPTKTALKPSSENDFLEIYAGRNEEEETDYNTLGLPEDRLWLSSKEWKGEHIEDYAVKARFKAFKKFHIEEWINYITAAAQHEAKVYPEIPWQLIAAQATIESGFGLSRVSVLGNNLFGHKCYNCDAAEGEAIIAHDDDIDDHFKVNNSKWWSIRSHSKLLMRKYYPRIGEENKPTLARWLNALCGCQNTAGAKKFVDNGNFVYATSCYNGSNYTKKLRSIIKSYFND